MRFLRTLVVVTTALLIPALVQSQPPGGFGGGRGGFSFDPDQMFTSMAKGKDTIVIAELDGFQKMMMERTAQTLGITNGQITREQYKQAMASRMGGRGPGGTGGPTPPAAPGAAPGAAPAPNFDAMADQVFDSLDRNRDGVLDNDEMTDALRSEVSKWDKNQDGLIDKNEYRPYFAAYMAARRAERGAGTPTMPSTEGDEEDRRAVVFRAGKLPKDIPAWFAQLDTDGDGQIGYYEWKKSGRTLQEFKEYDRNGDMFITIEEVMLVERTKNPSGSAVASSGAPGGSGMFGGPSAPGGMSGGMPGFTGGRGGFGPGSFGPGGFGGSRGGDPGAIQRNPGSDNGGTPGMRPGGGRRGPRNGDGSDQGDTGMPRGGRGKNKG